LHMKIIQFDPYGKQLFTLFECVIDPIPSV